MSDYSPEEVAEHIQNLSVALIESAFSVGNAAVMLQQAQDELKSMAIHLQDLVNTLPPEVKERLEYKALEERQKINETKNESLIDIIRKMLNGGN